MATANKFHELIQVRMDTNTMVGQISEKMKYLYEPCDGCNGSGLAPAVFGLQDACALCFGKGKKLDIVKSFGKDNGKEGEE